MSKQLWIALLVVVCAMQLIAAVSVESGPVVVTDPDLSYDEQQAYTAWRRLEHKYREKVIAKRARVAAQRALENPPTYWNKTEIVVVKPGRKLGTRYQYAVLDDPSITRSFERLSLNLPPARHEGYGSMVFDRLPKRNEEQAVLVKKLPKEHVLVIRTPLPRPVHTPVYEPPKGPLTVTAKLQEGNTIIQAPVPPPELIPVF